jgi:hypothetical protein
MGAVVGAIIVIVVVVLFFQVVGKVVFRRQLRTNREDEEIRQENLRIARENKKQRGKTRENAPAHAVSVGAADGRAPVNSSVTGISSELKELASLRDSGALSEAQFEAAKAKLLDP